MFGNAAWLDSNRHDQHRLKVSGLNEPPPYEDMLDLQKAEKYDLIETEGDGYKSYVGIAIALMLGRRPVCLIDEPEMCLHPPQAYALGQFIGRYGTSEKNVTFVATHSSHVLRGIIEKADRLRIIRLTNVNRKFHAHIVDNDLLRASIKRPSTRTELILDGLFSQAVAIVEAEGDRAVYQAAGESNESDFGREVHFVAVNGTGGIAEICRFYRSLNIPFAVIADLEVITDRPKIKAFLNELAAAEEASAILELCRDVEQDLRAIPPILTEQAVKDELLSIADSIKSWADREDVAVKSRLSSLEKRVSRIHRLKSGGVPAFESFPSIKEKLEQIVERSKTVGLFLVPGGELESWVPDLTAGVSKNNKAEWADAAASQIRAAGKREGDVWGFVKSVTEFLRRRATSAPAL